MRTMFWFLIPLLAAGCAAVQSAASSAPAASKRADLKDYGSAPELTNETWLNTDKTLRLADLRGKVVMLEMWTFGCINCQHVIPSLRDWNDRYADQGWSSSGTIFPNSAMRPTYKI